MAAHATHTTMTELCYVVVEVQTENIFVQKYMLSLNLEDMVGPEVIILLDESIYKREISMINDS